MNHTLLQFIWFLPLVRSIAAICILQIYIVWMDVSVLNNRFSFCSVVGGVIFICLQQIVIIDCSYSWNDSWYVTFFSYECKHMSSMNMMTYHGSDNVPIFIMSGSKNPMKQNAMNWVRDGSGYIQSLCSARSSLLVPLGRLLTCLRNLLAVRPTMPLYHYHWFFVS